MTGNFAKNLPSSRVFFVDFVKMFRVPSCSYFLNKLYVNKYVRDKLELIRKSSICFADDLFCFCLYLLF